MKKYLLILLVALCHSAWSQSDLSYQTPPDDIKKLVDAPLTPSVWFSPDKSVMVLLDRSDLPSIEELSRPELRIAGLRINPDNFGPSRNNFFIGMKVKKLSDKKDYEITGLPNGIQMSSPAFSPDSKKFSFIQTWPDRLELWVVDLTTLSAKKLSSRKVNATMGGVPYSWLSNSNSILYASAANEGNQAPIKTRVPSGPVVEENLGKKAPSRTYQDLLKNPYDESLFEFHCTSQLIVVSLDGSEKTVGSPNIFAPVQASFNPSPDGKMILTKTIQKPYSYLVPASLFAMSVQVMDLNGVLLKKIADMPLADNVPLGFNAVAKGPRSHAWRSDQPATLFWAEAQDGGDPKVKADIRDKVYQWVAPFSATPSLLVSTPLRFSTVIWGNEKVAWVYENWWADRKQRVYQIDPSTTATKKTVFDYSFEDAYNDPGNVVMAANVYGRQTMVIQNNSVFLTGDGSSPDGDLPFLDRLDLTSLKKTRVWRCEAPYYEWVAGLLDTKKISFVTSRESNAENPNFFIRSIDSKTITPLTNFPHPYPQIKDVKKQVLRYKRDDGVEMTADLYLPPNYKKEDGPLPTFVWAYPAEYKSKAAAGQVKGSPHTFTRINAGGPLFWVVRGYAVLDNASMPIVGEGTDEPNDTYIPQLVSNAKAVVEYGSSLGVVDRNRVGVGGHSYGAFMTMNLLAHCDYFKAGIARSGAYNRTLTPFGFQSEERSYWEAPEVYYNMSPFSNADKINEPVLMIHGEADNNSGTFPIQSERMYNAIKGHGGTARFVLLPYESHGYRARESVLHTLAEMDTWLEKYVKGTTELPAKTKVDFKN
jgi:dipeptidyl aminopeptidase/acylaminoacyl peptidase